MDRYIRFEKLHNVRDLGGYRTGREEQVVAGALYRADSLGKLADDDWRTFLGLGVRTVVDLRYPWEIERAGRVPQVERFGYHNLSIEHRPYDQAALGEQVDPWRYLADRYAEVLDDGAAEIAQVLTVLADEPGPAVFHCASGKDRTGIVAALLLTVLGVPRAQVLDDFALTELATDRLVADWWAAYPDRDRLWSGYGRAPAAILDLTLADLDARYGSVEAYLRDHAGLADDVPVRLRERWLEPVALPSGSPGSGYDGW